MLVCSIFSGWHRNFFVLPVVCMWKLQKYYHYIPYESKDVSEVRTKRSGKLLLYIFSLERTRHRVEGKKWSPRTLKALSWNISLILPPTTSYDPRVIKAIYHYIYGFPTALHSLSSRLFILCCSTYIPLSFITDLSYRPFHCFQCIHMGIY